MNKWNKNYLAKSSSIIYVFSHIKGSVENNETTSIDLFIVRRFYIFSYVMICYVARKLFCYTDVDSTFVEFMCAPHQNYPIFHYLPKLGNTFHDACKSQ